VWVQGPGHEPWEVYTVKADADRLTKQAGSACCGGDSADESIVMIGKAPD